MHLNLFDYFLWFVSPTVQAAILVAMYRRKLHSLFTRFFAYTILQVVAVPLLALLFYRSYTEYYYSYYVNLALSILMSFAVILEVTRVAFGQDEKSLKVLQLMWTAVVLVGFVLLGATTPRTHSMNGAITDSLMLADRASRIFQLVLLMGFVLFQAWLRITARSFVYGIVLGFGLFAFINMLVAAAASHRTWISSAALSRINSLSYFIATLIWLAYAVYGSPGPSAVERPNPESPTEREIREWIDRNFRDPQMSAARTRSLV